jgi:hypothetical protein
MSTAARCAPGTTRLRHHSRPDGPGTPDLRQGTRLSLRAPACSRQCCHSGDTKELISEITSPDQPGRLNSAHAPAGPAVSKSPRRFRAKRRAPNHNSEPTHRTVPVGLWRARTRRVGAHSLGPPPSLSVMSYIDLADADWRLVQRTGLGVAVGLRMPVDAAENSGATRGKRDPVTGPLRAHLELPLLC